MKLAFYKGTRKGLQGLYSRLTRWVDSGPYSHCELVFSDGLSASASFIDGGVRFKQIEYKPEHWDIINIQGFDEDKAKQWFEQHKGEKYDLMGNLRFIFFFIKPSLTKYFCSEAIAEALGFVESWRLGPNGLSALLNK